MQQKIYLWGFMGSGKSTVGKKLAKALALPFADLDAAIEQRSNLSVPEIFSKYGEAQFRKLEREALHSFETEKFVMATGGGTPCYLENARFMNETGLTVYLELPPPVLADRLMNAKQPRPLLKGFSKEELPGFVTDRLKERELYYLKAMLKVDGIGLKGDRLTELTKAVRQFM